MVDQGVTNYFYTNPAQSPAIKEQKETRLVSFLVDVQELKTGLIIFRRADVKHRNWYCRVKVPREDRYKTISLKTSDIHEARDKAFDHDADIRFRVKHDVPIFDKSFAEVAQEYSDHQKKAAQIGQITMERWVVIDGYIRLHLVPFMGHLQILHVGEGQWKEYPFWRKENNAPKELKRPVGRNPKIARKPLKLRAVKPDAGTEQEIVKPHVGAKDGTIRQEMMTFRGIMNFAADKNYIRERQVPGGNLPSDEARREAFTPQEYRKLHTDARSWIKEGKTQLQIWYRSMAYNFMLVMTNTGMRTIEARHLKWKNVDVRRDQSGKQIVVFNVWGKKKYRELVAAPNVIEYLERIRALFTEARKLREPDADNDKLGPKPDDFVFAKYGGQAAADNYGSYIEDLLTKSDLLISSSGSRRSAYCFRHTYATFRLMAGTDVYFLAKQMGTSVKMIEKYYGHIAPTKNAERILHGVPEWESAAGTSGEPPTA